MFRYRRLLSALTFAAILIGVPSASALAGSSAQMPGARCPSGTVCDSTLGLALTVPSGWTQIPRGKFLPHTLVFGTRPGWPQLPSSPRHHTVRPGIRRE